MPPERFVRLAENAGLVARLDAAVLRRALDQLGDWLRDGPGTAALAVNVSAAHLGDGALADLVADALAEAGIAPSRLIAEITESAIAGDIERAVTEVDGLRRLPRPSAPSSQ